MRCQPQRFNRFFVRDTQPVPNRGQGRPSDGVTVGRKVRLKVTRVYDYELPKNLLSVFHTNPLKVTFNLFCAFLISNRQKTSDSC